MEKRIVYIAYLIIAFVFFNFFYGFTDWVATWQMWNWYLVILLLTIASLLIIKYKQNQRKLALEQYVKENDRRRIQLGQLLLFEQLEQLNEGSFYELLQRFFELQGYKAVEVSKDSETSGYNLLMWDEGKKIIVKCFKRVPMVKNLYTDADGLDFALGELVGLNEVREFYGCMKDFDVQADIAIVLSTSDFSKEAMLFAARNGIHLMNGHQFYHALHELKEEELSENISREMCLSEMTP